jgi:hypothetical protein
MNRRDLLLEGECMAGGATLSRAVTAGSAGTSPCAPVVHRLGADLVEVKLEAAESSLRLGRNNARLMTYNASF